MLLQDKKINPESLEYELKKELFLKLLLEDSQTDDFMGVEKVQRIIANQLKELGFETQLMPNSLFISGPLLVANKKSVLKNSQKNSQIVFVAHADTVNTATNKDKQKLQNFLENSKNWNSSEPYCYPSIIDNKAGVFILLNSLKTFLKQNPNHKNDFTVIISPNEEKGSPGFSSYFHDNFKKARFFLGYEPSTEDGSLIIGRKGNYWVEISTKTSGGHSGRCGKHKADAALDLSRIIGYLHEELKDQDEISMHLSSFKSSEEVFNKVSQKAVTRIDFRFSSQENFFKIENILNKALEKFKHSDLQINLSVWDYCPSMNSSCPPVLKGFLYNKNLKNENRSLEFKTVGGSADINHFFHKDSIALDGLGAIGGKMHASDEYILFSSLETRSQISVDLLHYLENFYDC